MQHHRQLARDRDRRALLGIPDLLQRLPAREMVTYLASAEYRLRRDNRGKAFLISTQDNTRRPCPS
jgi:hypothetical protein